ncbi:hypothetical protein XU18_5236 [Perkinsela sp. CCAP 1560/4]|nr:hypothetical protein XU18_5236 [Perkinsela sp. CCAP 1560/4]|eukprot:KNH00559.1 hypothetical protein XU18_5236 [Perkinsela sp. CCAP 1560/4]
MRMCIQNALWQTFHGKNATRLTPFIPRTKANISPPAQKYDRWLTSLAFAVSYAPSLSSFRYILTHWLPLFIAFCAQSEQPETCFERIDQILHAFPNHVITAPLVEIIVCRMVQVISRAPDINSAERLQSGVIHSILHPIIHRLERGYWNIPYLTETDTRNGTNGHFDLKSRLIAAPGLFLYLWSSVYANQQGRLSMPITMHHLVESLLSANQISYAKLYYAEFLSTPEGDARKESRKELWSTALQLCSLSALMSRVHGQSDTMGFYYHSKSDMPQHAAWVGYYVLRSMCIWQWTESPHLSAGNSVNTWEAALQISKTLLRTLSPHSVFWFYFLAETLPILPAEMWVKSLRVFLPESTKRKSDWELACEFLRRTGKVSLPQSCALCENGLVKVKNQRDIKLPIIAELNFLLKFLRGFVSTEKHERLSEPRRESLHLLPTVHLQESTSGDLKLKDALSEQLSNPLWSVSQTPSSLLLSPPALEQNIRTSAISILACAKQRRSTWHDVIALLSLHLKTFGMHKDFQAVTMSVLRRNEGSAESSFQNSHAFQATGLVENYSSQAGETNAFTSQARKVHWICSCSNRYKLPFISQDSLQQKDQRKTTSDSNIVGILFLLTHSMLTQSDISNGSNFRKMALLMLRSSIHTPWDEQPWTAHKKKSISTVSSVLSSVLTLMQCQTAHVLSNWKFGLRLLVSLNKARDLKSLTEDVQPHKLVKQSTQQMAKACLNIGLWQAAIAYTLFFQKCVRSQKHPSLGTKGVPLVTSVRYPLNIADHRIVRQSVERTLRAYLERKSRVTENSSWELVLQASKYILRPLRKVERTIITPSSAKVVPTQYYRFDPCCLLRWAQSHVPDHGTYFRLLMSLSPIHRGELRPMDYLVQWPNKFEPWRITFNSERWLYLSQAQKDYASQHFFFTLQRCIAHPRLWQQAVATLLLAIKIRDRKNAIDDSRSDGKLWTYTDVVFRIFGSNGPDIHSYMTMDGICGQHMKMAAFSPFCQTIQKLCTTHSVDIVCGAIIPVLLPLLEPSAVTPAFWDSLIHILTRTIILHAHSRDGNRILQAVISLCVRNLPRRFGYSLTDQARISVRQAIAHLNGSKRIGEDHVFFETNIPFYSPPNFNNLAYRWGEIVRAFSKKLRNLAFYPETDKRQRLGKPLVNKLVDSLLPSLQLDMAMPPSATLGIIYDYLVICHELPKDVIAYFVLLLSVGCQVNRKNTDTATLEHDNAEELREAHQKILKILRLQKDLELMYHVKSVFFSVQKKRVEVDSLAGLMANLRVDYSNRASHKENSIVPDTVQARVPTSGSGMLPISVERLMEVSWWCYANRSAFFEYSHSIRPTRRRLSHSFVMTASMEPRVQLTYSITSKHTEDVRKINLSRILRQTNRNQCQKTGSMRIEKEIFACLCEMLRPRDGIPKSTKETFAPRRAGYLLTFDSSTALCYAMLSDQLGWKVLLNTVFNGSIPMWREGLSKAQLLRIDMGE